MNRHLDNPGVSCNAPDRAASTREFARLYDAILEGNATIAQAVTREALNAGCDPLALTECHMVPAMAEVGRRFEAGEYFVPELLISARAMKTSMALIRPHLSERGARSLGRVVIGTVKGDVHDIGKHLVASLLEGAGFEVIDLGTGVLPERFISAIEEHHADIVGMSALLTTTMYEMKVTIRALQDAGVRQRVKVLVGGAPVTLDFAREIGADGFSNNAAGAVTVAKQALGIPAPSMPGSHLCTR